MKEMNPIEKFYERKKDYEETKRQSEAYNDLYEVSITGGDRDTFQVIIVLDKGLFGNVSDKGVENVHDSIAVYIQAHRDEIKKDVIKKLKEDMEKLKLEIKEDLNIPIYKGED